MKRKTAKENLKNICYALVIFVLIYFVLFVCATAQGQNVVRNGKTFVEKTDTTKAVKQTAKETDYLYVDRNGNAYPIYLSSNGKAFIVKVSKKSGKKYRKYLPEVSKELNK